MSARVPLLEVSGLVVRYGAVTAVRGVDLQVDEGEIVSIVGPNGAGKTSLRLGHRRHRSACCRQHRLCRQVARRHRARGCGGAGDRARSRRPPHFRKPDGDRKPLLGATVRPMPTACAPTSIARFAMFPILGERRRQPAGQLSGGEQQQLAIARALLSRPRLLMLDEPSLGLAPTVVDQVYVLLRSVRDQGVTILLIEQNAERVFGLSDRVHVMSGGEFGLSGTRRRDQGRSAFRRRLFRRPHERAGEAAGNGAPRPDPGRCGERRQPLRADRARHRPDFRRDAADQLSRTAN